MQDLRNKIMLKQTVVSSFTSRPPLNEAQRTEQAEAERELKELQEQLLSLAMQESPAAVVPQSADLLLETQILCNHLKSLPKFTGTNPEATQNFLARVKGITEACPSLTFARVLGAIKPNIAAGVVKTLDAAQDVSTFTKFSECLSRNYGCYSNVYQKLEEWMLKPKPYGESMTNHHCKITSELEPVIESFKATIIKMKREQGTEDYKPSFNDGFQAFKICKILQSVRSECMDTYSNIIIELSTFASSEQIAQRAESLNVQNQHAMCMAADGRKAADNRSAGHHQQNNKGSQNNKKADGDDRQHTNYYRGRGRGRGGNRGGNRGGYRGGHRGGKRGGAANRKFYTANQPEVTKLDSYNDKAWDDNAKVRIQAHGRVRGIPRNGPSGQGGAFHAHEPQQSYQGFEAEYQALEYDYEQDEYEAPEQFYNYGSSAQDEYEYSNDASLVTKNC